MMLKNNHSGNMKPRKKSVCRVCLQCDLDTESVSNIFETNDSSLVFVYDKLNTIAELHIKPKDGLPDKICCVCLLELENAINFKQKCETSNSILLSAANAGIGPTQDDVDPLDPVKSEPKEYSDQEYLEDDVCSPPEVPVKMDPCLHLNATDLHPSPAKLSKATRKIKVLKLECHDCGGSFRSKCKLKIHWKNVHLKEQLTCPICLKTCGSFRKRKEHDVKKTRRCKTLSQVDITGERKNPVLHCKECQYSTCSVNNMIPHLVTHTGERNYACKLCPKRYPQFDGLQVHMESQHGKGEQSLCKVCGKLITGSRRLYLHLKRHEDVSTFVTCKICDKSMKKRSLSDHMAIHSNVRRYPCDKCAATFKTSSSLANHNRKLHKGIKYYKCDKCEYTTNGYNSIKNHRNKHTGNNFPCFS